MFRLRDKISRELCPTIKVRLVHWQVLSFQGHLMKKFEVQPNKLWTTSLKGRRMVSSRVLSIEKLVLSQLFWANPTLAFMQSFNFLPLLRLPQHRWSICP